MPDFWGVTTLSFQVTTPYFFDVVVLSGIVRAHSIIVVSKSHVFQTMLAGLSNESGHGMKESQTGTYVDRHGWCISFFSSICTI